MEVKAKYFSADELKCPCCDELKIDSKALYMFDKFREYIGKPVIVHSGYRCAEHNEDVNGKPFSKHRKGIAIDFHVKGLEITELHGICLDLWREKKILTGGLGLYNTWVHIDSGGHRIWDNRRSLKN